MTDKREVLPGAGVEIELGGETHVLRFNTLGLMAAEDAGAFAEDVGNLRRVVTLVWAGIKHEGHGLSFEEVAEMVPLGAAEDLMAAVAEAIEIASADGAGTGKKKKTTPRGLKSGRRPGQRA